MSFYKLAGDSSLKDYYRVFATVWPFLFFIPFFVLLELVWHVSRPMFFETYLLSTGLAVLVGAPLFRWARHSDFEKDPRPILLASGVTVLLGTAPLVYALAKPLGFNASAALGAAAVAVVPWAALCLKPPTKLYERIRSKRTNRESR
jgi:hypothetical protein